MHEPSRGEIWLVDLNPIRGREQSGKRPVLIISVDGFNHSAAELIVVLPITTKQKNIPLHVELQQHEGGVTQVSYIKCEDIRSISKERLIDYWGSIDDSIMKKVEFRLRKLLNL